MIRCEDLARVFKENDLKFFTGVPDSTFKDWMRFINDKNGLTNRIAVNECEAVALATGYHLSTGRTGVVYMQNSGLGKTVNPLTSLVSKEVYSIPLVMMIGWRGEFGKKDEPQHKMMGRIMLSQLETLEIPYEILPDDIEEAKGVIERAKERANKNQYASAIIVKKGTLREYISQTDVETNYEMSREDAIKMIIDNLEGNETIVSTTGKTSRELFEYRVARNEQPRDFYTVGSMGCSASIGFEIAMQKSDKPVFIFDGDGAVLMQMGSLATIGHYSPKNFRHIIFDNSSYESTGGQPTVSDSINLRDIGAACGYKFSRIVKTKEGLIDMLKCMKKSKGPSLVVIKVNTSSRKDLGRPTSTPAENKKSFMNFLAK